MSQTDSATTTSSAGAESIALEDVPREPSAYRPSIHFADRFRDRCDDPYRRHLDGEIVNRCITEGTVSYQGSDCYGFHEMIGGVEYLLVVNPGNEKVVTAYPTKINWTVAEESGRWSQTQLEDIAEFLAADVQD